jgi:hypothetical protein
MSSLCSRSGDEACQCAVFQNIMGDNPIMSHSPGLVIPCNDEGKASCKAMCIALVSI